MGNREALLAAARTCVYQRGFAATTARDIAAAAGVSLAAIGYHFGSKERLLTEAFTEATGQRMGQDLDERIRAAARGRSRAEAFAHTWNGVAELFARHRDGIVASAENLIRSHRCADRRHMATVHERAIAELTNLIDEVDPTLTKPQARAIGQLYFALLNGLALQWISDPDSPLPTGDELATAITALTSVTERGRATETETSGHRFGLR